MITIYFQHMLHDLLTGRVRVKIPDAIAGQ